MSPENRGSAEGEMRDEYDIRGGVRGKYYERYQQGTNLVLLAPDVAAVFRNSDAVNRALRVLIEAGREQVRTTSEGPNTPPQPAGSAGG